MYVLYLKAFIYPLINYLHNKDINIIYIRVNKHKQYISIYYIIRIKVY